MMEEIIKTLYYNPELFLLKTGLFCFGLMGSIGIATSIYWVRSKYIEKQLKKEIEQRSLPNLN